MKACTFLTVMFLFAILILMDEWIHAQRAISKSNQLFVEFNFGEPRHC